MRNRDNILGLRNPTLGENPFFFFRRNDSSTRLTNGFFFGNHANIQVKHGQILV